MTFSSITYSEDEKCAPSCVVVLSSWPNTGWWIIIFYSLLWFSLVVVIRPGVNNVASRIAVILSRITIHDLNHSSHYRCSCSHVILHVVFAEMLLCLVLLNWTESVLPFSAVCLCSCEHAVRNQNHYQTIWRAWSWSGFKLTPQRLVYGVNVIWHNCKMSAVKVPNAFL